MNERVEVADDHLRRNRRIHFGHRRHVDLSIRIVHLVEDIVHYGVAAVLLGVSGVVLWHSGSELFHHETEFAERVTSVVNGTLFVIIVLEINISRLVVTLSPLQIAMFLIAQLVGVSIGLAVIGFTFPLPPGAAAQLASIGG